MKKGVLIAVAVGIAAALGFFAQQQLRPAAAVATASPTPPATETSSPGAVAPDSAAVAAEAAPKVPEVLPQFELADRDGKKRSLKEWAGRPLMVNFWATWCGPCRREIPLLNQLRKQRAAQACGDHRHRGGLP